MDDASVVVNKELDSLYEWICLNKLSINTYKTKYIVFKIRKQYVCPDIYINKNKIEKSTSIKFLGVIIDDT